VRKIDGVYGNHQPRAPRLCGGQFCPLEDGIRELCAKRIAASTSEELTTSTDELRSSIKRAFAKKVGFHLTNDVPRPEGGNPVPITQSML
jgi:hypothetical protein